MLLAGVFLAVAQPPQLRRHADESQSRRIVFRRLHREGRGWKPVTPRSCVKIRYGFAGVKHADLEIGTSSEGKARVEGLPDKARPMTWEVKKDDKTAEVTQDVADKCRATFDVTLR
jgi:hypothetical protein